MQFFCSFSIYMVLPLLDPVVISSLISESGIFESQQLSINYFFLCLFNNRTAGDLRNCNQGGALIALFVPHQICEDVPLTQTLPDPQSSWNYEEVADELGGKVCWCIAFVNHALFRCHLYLNRVQATSQIYIPEFAALFLLPWKAVQVQEQNQAVFGAKSSLLVSCILPFNVKNYVNTGFV